MELKTKQTYEAVTLKVVEIKSRGVLCDVSISQEDADQIIENGGDW